MLARDYQARTRFHRLRVLPKLVSSLFLVTNLLVRERSTSRCAFGGKLVAADLR
jgi:hypothetical protein